LDRSADTFEASLGAGIIQMSSWGSTDPDPTNKVPLYDNRKATAKNKNIGVHIPKTLDCGHLSDQLSEFTGRSTHAGGRKGFFSAAIQSMGSGPVSSEHPDRPTTATLTRYPSALHFSIAAVAALVARATGRKVSRGSSSANAIVLAIPNAKAIITGIAANEVFIEPGNDFMMFMSVVSFQQSHVFRRCINRVTMPCQLIRVEIKMASVGSIENLPRCQ
jgi:hypothetical protein